MRELVAEFAPEQSEPPEVVVVDGRRSFDFDADSSAVGGFDDDVDLGAVPVPEVG